MKIFILGSSSFCGASLARYLLMRGHRVFGSGRTERGKGNGAFRELVEFETFKYLQIDFRDTENLIGALDQVRPEILINYTSMGMVGQSWEDPALWADVNCTGLANLVFRLQRCGYIKHFIHFSTPEVYGSAASPVRENWDFRPSSPYAASRAYGDRLLYMYAPFLPFTVTITRASNVIGPGQQMYRFLPCLISSLELERSFFIDGDGNYVRNFIDAADVNNAIIKLIDTSSAGEFHISGDDYLSINEMCSFVVKKMGADPSLVTHRDSRKSQDRFYMLDSTRLRNLGWRPKVSLDTSLDQIRTWLMSNDFGRRFEQEYVIR